MSADTSRKGLIVLAAIISANLLVASSAASATSSTRHIFDDTPRPLGEISLIGDSVLLGSLTFGPNLVEQLAEQGWGPIRSGRCRLLNRPPRSTRLGQGKRLA